MDPARFTRESEYSVGHGQIVDHIPVGQDRDFFAFVFLLVVGCVMVTVVRPLDVVTDPPT